MDFNLFIDERMMKVDELFDLLKSKDGVRYLKVYESPVISKSIKFITESRNTKEVIREHLTEAGYYSYYEIWKNI